MNKIDAYIIICALLACGFVAADMWLISSGHEQFNPALCTAFVGALIGEVVCLCIKTVKLADKDKDDEDRKAG